MANSGSWRGERLTLASLDAVVVFPKDRPATHWMVLCHGFGAPGEDLAGLAGSYAEISEAMDLSPVMIFPAAPIDLGEEGMLGARAWWKLNMARLMELTTKGTFGEMRSEVPPGIDEARQALVELVEVAETKFGLVDLPLLLGGFSQGAMLAVDTALRGLAKPPSGMVIYSGALICEEIWKVSSSRLQGTKIFQSHGRQDFILPVETGKWLGELLEKNAQQHELMLFNGPHTIPPAAIQKTMDLLSSM